MNIENVENYKSVKHTKMVSNIILITLLGLGAIVVIIPFIWMVMISFDWEAVTSVPYPPRFIPLSPTFKTYQIAFINVPMARYIVNTIIITVGVILFSCSSALLAAYALSKIRFKGSKFVLIFSLSLLMIPFEASMVSRYLMFSNMSLLNSYWAFFLPSIAHPFGTFMAKQYMDALPMSMREAAKIDGAKEHIIFYRIYVPLCGPIIATMVILQFLDTWNTLVWPLLVLSDPAKYTIQIGMAMFTMNKGASSMPAIQMAVTTISILPVLIVYLFLQKYIIESIAMTGLKQ